MLNFELIIVLLISLVIAVVLGNFISNLIQKKTSSSSKEIIDKIDTVKRSFEEEFRPISTELTTNKTLIQEKADNIQKVHEKLTIEMEKVDEELHNLEKKNEN